MIPTPSINRTAKRPDKGLSTSLMNTPNQAAARAFRCGGPAMLALALLAALTPDQTTEAQSLGDIANQVLQQAAQNGTQGQTSGVLGAALSDTDIASGLREALAKGTRTAVTQLGRTDGFWGDERFRIPLPGKVAQISSLLQAAGYSSQIDQFHLTMNRAAEQAVPLAANVFSEAVRKLTLNDVRTILNGPQDAATQYFKRTTSDTLMGKFKPVVSSMTSKIGLVQRYNTLLESAGPAASLIGGGGAPDINDYVARKALDSLFLRVADEEKSIRTNPAARSSDLLKKVFGR